MTWIFERIKIFEAKIMYHVNILPGGNHIKNIHACQYHTILCTKRSFNTKYAILVLFLLDHEMKHKLII